MDELMQYFKNLEENEFLKLNDAYNRGWYDAMNNPEVNKALERMKPEKVIERWSQYGIEYGDCPTCICPVERKFWDDHQHCDRCGQALDWSEE